VYCPRTATGQARTEAVTAHLVSFLCQRFAEYLITSPRPSPEEREQEIREAPRCALDSFAELAIQDN
jgi:hypothetical protein